MTREEVIAKHRRMWNWIADKTLECKEIVSKEKYIFRNDPEFKALHSCYCCHFVNEISESGGFYDGICGKCPLIWANDENKWCCSDDGEYEQWLYERDYVKSAELARKIANLPERKI